MPAWFAPRSLAHWVVLAAPLLWPCCEAERTSGAAAETPGAVPAAIASAAASTPTADSPRSLLPLADKTPPPLPPPAEVAEIVTVYPVRGESLRLFSEWAAIPPEALIAENGEAAARTLPVHRPFRLRLTPSQLEQFQRKRQAFLDERKSKFFRHHRLKYLATYAVQEGDRLWDICQRNGGVPLWLLEEVNRNYSLKSLSAGDIINVPIVESTEAQTDEETKQRVAELDKVAGPPEPGGSPPVESLPRDVAPDPVAAERAAAHFKPALAAEPPSAAPAGGAAPGADAMPGAASEARPSWYDGPVAEAVESAPWYYDPDDKATGFDGIRVKVMRGETLRMYARWSGLTIERILAANELLHADRLSVGQSIVLPLTGSAISDFFVQRKSYLRLNDFSAETKGTLWQPYRVRPGDTAWKIVRKNPRLDMKTLERFNPGVNMNNLRVGSTLRIPIPQP